MGGILGLTASSPQHTDNADEGSTVATPTQAESPYTILVPGETLTRAEQLLAELHGDPSKAGGLLQRLLATTLLKSLGPLELLELLFETRRPQIFAESEVAGDGLRRRHASSSGHPSRTVPGNAGVHGGCTARQRPGEHARRLVPVLAHIKPMRLEPDQP